MIEITEEWITTDFFTKEPITILTPNMKMWIFPPKEDFKKIIKEEMARGKFGPEGKPPGPSPAEKEMMRKDPKTMSTIRSIANAFGGEANIVINVYDEEGSIFKILMQINENDLINIKPAIDYTGEVDATLNINFDFFYNAVIEAEKESRSFHIERPEWDTRPRPQEKFSEAVHGIKMLTAILTGILSGKISVDPPTAWPSLIFTFTSMLKMMIGT